MFRSVRTNWFKILINLVGGLCLVVHILFIGHNQLNPSETVTTLHNKPLDQIEFPLVFKICIIPPLNLSVLQSVGYKNLKEGSILFASVT